MQIPEIKQLLTISQVIAYYNYKPDTNAKMCCPFHDDGTPSMQVYEATNTVYCFSSNCKTHGKSLDVIDFIMQRENCSKHEALLKCKMIIGMATQQPATLKITKPITKQNLDELFITLTNNLPQNKAAKTYCATRKLNTENLQIGYNLKTFASLKNCIIFALCNSENKITGLYGRSITDNENSKHYYYKDSLGIYPNYPNANTQKLIITESIIDAASLLQNENITNDYTILAAYGTNRLNAEMQTAIKNLTQLNEIIFAFDSDEAGRQASIKYATMFNEAMPNLIYSTLELPNKDLNETLMTNDENIFIPILNKRKDIFMQKGNENETQSKEQNEALNSNESQEQNEVQNNNQSEAKPTTTTTTELPTASKLNLTNPLKIVYNTSTAIYYIQGGLPKTTEHLKIMLVVECKESAQKARNKIDLYEDKQVEKLVREVAEKLYLDKYKLQNDFDNLTNLLEHEVEKTLPKMNAEEETENQLLPLTQKEKTELENFLKQPKLLKQLNEKLGKTGIVGEERNRIFLLLIAISYKMKDPLHSLIQGSSGSGKTKIVRQVSDCIPQENVTRFTRISDKALYNYPQNYFKNRLIIIEDVDGLSEEAEFAFRELQSNGELNSATSVKLDNGQITSAQKTVYGPIASMSCTTKGEIYEDNMSRVFLIAVDESNEQTQRIIDYQNKKASGKINSNEEQEAKVFIQNMIRLLATKEVVNPYAEEVQLPKEADKKRRLNFLFQCFIKMVGVINQYQRKENNNKQIIADIADIEMAVEIMFESIVLKCDELDGSLRQFYEQLKNYLQKTHKENYLKATFTQREIRQSLHVSKSQINRYLQALVELEYLTMNGFINKGFTYKISYWDNYEALRKRIKEDLMQQVNTIKVRLQNDSQNGNNNQKAS